MPDRFPDESTVRFWREAKVGDWLWHRAGNGNVYDKDNKYLGRGKLRLEQVTKIARKYLTLNGYNEFSVEDGSPRLINGWAPPDRIFGLDEMWMDLNHRKVVNAVEECRDIDTIRKIAALVASNPEVSNA